MNGRIAVLVSIFALLAIVALPHAQIVPYSNSTQVGYHIINISTYDTSGVVIGIYLENFTQNYITPNESGVTVDGHSYYLNLNTPMPLYDQNSSYIVLVKVNYIPRLHTVDFNIYQLQPVPMTTTTTSVPTISTTSIETTTTVLPANTITSASSTTTIAQSLGVIGSVFQQIISFLQSLLSHI